MKRKENEERKEANVGLLSDTFPPNILSSASVITGHRFSKIVIVPFNTTVGAQFAADS